MPFRLHLDLDGVLGVLADFDAGLRAVGLAPDPSLNRRNDLLPPEACAGKRRIQDAALSPGFYLRLPTMPGFDRLAEAARAYPEVFVLTAVPSVATPAQVATVAAEKAAWVARHLPWIPADRFRWTHGSHGKAAHVEDARPRAALLLDDRAENCAAWTDAGGLAIHHTDAARSVAILLRHLGR